MTGTLLLAARVVLSLAVVLALLWFIARRVSRTGVVSRGVRLEVLARQNLTRRAGVALVAVEGRRFLLGTGDMGVSLIQELSPEPGSAAGDTTLDEGGNLPLEHSRSRAQWRQVWAEATSQQDAGGLQHSGDPQDSRDPQDTTGEAGTPVPAGSAPVAGEVVAAVPVNADATPDAPVRTAPTGGSATPLPLHAASEPVLVGQELPSRRAASGHGETSPLAGSILSPRTWSRAWQAVHPQERR